MKETFRKTSHKIANIAGHPYTSILAILTVLIWAFSGHYFNYSNTWQLVINTTTTIVTFLMVFLIQNTQNREARMNELKLDELIRATRARDAFIDLDEMTDADLDELDQQFHHLHEKNLATPAIRKLHSHIKATRQSRGKKA